MQNPHRTRGPMGTAARCRWSAPENLPTRCNFHYRPEIAHDEFFPRDSAGVGVVLDELVEGRLKRLSERLVFGRDFENRLDDFGAVIRTRPRR
jgi:hypothetical protein